MQEKDVHPSVISLQETWTFPLTNENELKIEGYKLILNSRVASRGGGVGFYVKNGLNFKKIESMTIMHEKIFECIGLELKINDFLLCIGNFYRPPHFTENDKGSMNFFNMFENWLDIMNDQYLNVILCGDFNVNLSNDNNKLTQFMSNLFASYSLQQQFFLPTRLSNNPSLIDNIFLSKIFDCFSLQCYNSFSDHNILATVLNLKSAAIKEGKKQFTRFFSGTKIIELKQILWNTPWEKILVNSDINNVVDKFHDIFFHLYESFFPLTEIKKSRSNKNKLPYFDAELKELQKIKNKSQRLFLKTRLQHDRINFVRARNNFNYKLRQKKRHYFHEKIEKLKYQPRDLWKFLSENVGLGKSQDRNSIQEEFYINDIISRDGQKIADNFNLHFKSIGEKVVEKLDKSKKDTFVNVKYDKRIKFRFSIITPMKIFRIIESLKNKRSADIFGLSNFIIKKLSFELAIPLAIIIEQSLKDGIFPSAWKNSIITPVYKNKGDSKDMTNYRPIAAIPIFAKILETVVSEDLMIYLECNNLLNNQQFGFRKFRSVHQAIISFINNITMELNSNNNTGCLLLDCEKAFDTVNRKELLLKLESYGILGKKLNWFDSYMSDRTQKVKYNNILSSNTFSSKYGVLQGSALSAGLFLIYINDLKLDSVKNVLLYADDCALNFNIKTEKDIINISQEVENWYSNNHLSLNKNKSELLIFTPGFKELNMQTSTFFSNYKFFINNSILKTNVRYLGIYLDQKLSFHHSMKKSARLCAIGTSSLIKVKYLFPQDAKIKLYAAFVHSHLNFISHYFFSGTKSEQKTLKKIQKRALRAVENVSTFSHTAQIFKKLNILPIEKLAEYNIFKFMYRLNGYSEMKSIFPYWQNKTAQFHLRNSHHYEIPKIKPYLMSKNLPISIYPRIFNRYIDIFTPNIGYGDQWAKLKEHLIDEYLESNKCTSAKTCFVCKKAQILSPDNAKNEKLQRIKELIAKKGTRKRLKYNNLRTRYIKHVKQ